MKSFEETLEKENVFIIAELGVNYYEIAIKKNLSIMDAAKLMIDEAKKMVLMLLNFNLIKQKVLLQKMQLLIGI